MAYYIQINRIVCYRMSVSVSLCPTIIVTQCLVVVHKKKNKIPTFRKVYRYSINKFHSILLNVLIQSMHIFIVIPQTLHATHSACSHLSKFLKVWTVQFISLKKSSTCMAYLRHPVAEDYFICNYRVFKHVWATDVRLKFKQSVVNSTKLGFFDIASADDVHLSVGISCRGLPLGSIHRIFQVQLRSRGVHSNVSILS